MVEAEYKLYREAEEAAYRLPPASAKAFLEQLAAQNGDSDPILAELCFHCIACGQRAYAKQVSDRLLAKGRSAWALAAAANVCHEFAEDDASADLSEEALEADGENVAALDVAMLLASECGDYESASIYARRKFEADRANPEAYFMIGFLPIIEHDFEAAKSALKNAPSEFIGTPRQRSISAWIARHEGRRDEAVDELRAALEVRPYNAMLWASLSSHLYSTGRLEEAAEAVKKSLEVNPIQSVALSISAHLAAKRGDLVERDRLQQLIRQQSPRIGAVTHTSAAAEFIRRNMPREAIRAFELMERDGKASAKRLSKELKLQPLADLGRWKEVRQILDELGGRSWERNPVSVARARLAAHDGCVALAIKQLEDAFSELKRSGPGLRWLLVFASESGDNACLGRLGQFYAGTPAESPTEAAGVAAWFYAVQAFDAGDAVLRAALAKYPNCVDLTAIEAWRLVRVGLKLQADQIRATLPVKWLNWKPPKTLRPPKYDPLTELGRQFARRIGVRV